MAAHEESYNNIIVGQVGAAMLQHELRQSVRKSGCSYLGCTYLSRLDRESNAPRYG